MSTADARARGERGAVAVMMGAVAVILFVIAALVVDLGLARDNRRQSQNTSDAAALAGANALYPPGGSCTNGTSINNGCIADAVDAAKAYAVANFGLTDADWARCPAAPATMVVPAGAPTCIAFDLAVTPTKIRVQLPTHDQKTGLGTLAGVATIKVDSAARASLTPGRRYECGICVLGPGPHTIGNGDALSGGSDVHFNGSVSTGPNGGVCAGTFNAATGGCAPSASITVESTATGSFSPAPEQNAGGIEDPFLTSLSLPPTPMGSVKTGSPCIEGPGIYLTDFTFPDGSCVLASGLYVVAGEWQLGNTSTVTNDAGGASFYFTCKQASPLAVRACGSTNGGVPENGGKFNRKNGAITLSAQASGPLAGHAIVYDRLNNSDLDLQGNGTSNITGNVYAPAALLYANGTSANTFQGGAVIVNSIYLNGNDSALTMMGGSEATWVRQPADLALDQ